APHAAVSATVEAARVLGKGAHAGLINAVLRRSQREGLAASDNIDRIAYEIARNKVGHLVKDWQSSDAWYQITKIGNYKALLVHGDEIKSFGGNTPAFSILRKVNAWAGGVIEDFHDCYMGHWHTPMSLTMSNGGRIFVTGSPESHNEYAREFVAATGIPSQRLHFIDPDKGRVAAEYVVWLD
ncbi:MAG: transcription antitermination factor NusB, partial [Limnohabitans sp.]